MTSQPLVVVPSERLDHRIDAGVAEPKLAEDAAAQRLLEALALGFDVIHDRRPAVLDVDVPDELVVVVHRLGRVGPAEPEMPGVQAQPEQRRVDPVHDPGDLVGGFDVGAGVRVEDDLEAVVAADLGRAVEVRRSASRTGPAAATPRGARAIRPENARRSGSSKWSDRIANVRDPSGAPSRDEPQAVAQPRAILVSLLVSAEMLGQERADELSPRDDSRSRSVGASPRNPGGPSSVPSKPMPTIQSSMSSGPGIQASSTMISSTPNETGALATRMRSATAGHRVGARAGFATPARAADLELHRDADFHGPGVSVFECAQDHRRREVADVAVAPRRAR